MELPNIEGTAFDPAQSGGEFVFLDSVDGWVYPPSLGVLELGAELTYDEFCDRVLAAEINHGDVVPSNVAAGGYVHEIEGLVLWSN